MQIILQAAFWKTYVVIFCVLHPNYIFIFYRGNQQ